jgi:hypothetical protein
MNVLLWILQVALAFFLLAGGATKAFKYDSIEQVPSTSALPREAWIALGVFEMAAAVLLIAPAAIGWMPSLTAFAAAAVAVEGLALSISHGRYSLDLAATNPMIWSIVMTVLAAVVAFGRWPPA